MAGGYKIEGMDKVLKNMRMLREIGKLGDVGNAAFEAAKYIEARAKVRAGLVTKRKTGKLIKAIKAKRGSGRSAGTATCAVDRKVAPHSHLVEFGTGPRHHKKTGKYVGQMPARPYFRPTVDISKERVKRILSRGAKQALEKATR